jgi:hypothetical protein
MQTESKSSNQTCFPFCLKTIKKQQKPDSVPTEEYNDITYFCHTNKFTFLMQDKKLKASHRRWVAFSSSFLKTIYDLVSMA